MPSGDVSRFGGAKGGRPAKAPTPQLESSEVEYPKEGISGVPGRSNAESCNKKGCGKVGTNFLVARDRDGNTDSAVLCNDHSKGVARRAKGAGHQVKLQRLNERNYKLHKRLADTDDVRDVLEEGLVRRGIAPSDALVGREEIKPGQRTGRPTEVFKDPRARHLQAVRKRRTEEELEANVNDYLGEIKRDTFVRLAPSMAEGGNTEAGRSYSEFMGSFSERVSENPTINYRDLTGGRREDSAYRAHLAAAGVQVGTMDNAHVDALRPLFPDAPPSRTKNTPYTFRDRRTGETRQI